MDKRIATKYLAFLSMSDGHLCMHEGCINASFAIMMKKESFDFLERYAIPALEEFNIGYSVITQDEKYKGIRTRVHPVLTKLWERVYYNRRQSLSPHDIKQLDWESMSILYMADGSIQKSGKIWYPMLNMCNLSYPEMCWFKAKVKDKLDIDINIYKCGKYFRYGVPKKDVDTFFNGVRPYLVNSFLYKHPDGRPQQVLGGDIV